MDWVVRGAKNQWKSFYVLRTKTITIMATYLLVIGF